MTEHEIFQIALAASILIAVPAPFVGVWLANHQHAKKQEKDRDA